MVRQPMSRRWHIVLGFVSVLILLAVYYYFSHRQHVINPNDTTVPTISQLKEGVVKIIEEDRRGDRWIIVDTKATLTRLALGMAVGTLAGIILGIHMGCFAWIEALFVPPIALMANVPPTAALTVFFVMVGTGQEMYVSMIAVGILPALANSVYLAVQEIPDQLIYKAYTLGASRTEVVWNVISRIVLPKVIDAVRIQTGAAMVYLIAAEMVVGHEGFGYRIRLQSKLLNMSSVYPYLLLLALFGFCLHIALKQSQRLACPWYHGSTKGH